MSCLCSYLTNPHLQIHSNQEYHLASTLRDIEIGDIELSEIYVEGHLWMLTFIFLHGYDKFYCFLTTISVYDSSINVFPIKTKGFKLTD